MHSLSLDDIKTRMPQNLWNEKSHDKRILTETSGRRGHVAPAPVLQAHCSRRDTRVKVVTLVTVVGDLTANSVLVGMKASVANRVRRSTWDRCSGRKEETAEEKYFHCVHGSVFFKRREAHFVFIICGSSSSFFYPRRQSYSRTTSKQTQCFARACCQVSVTNAELNSSFFEELKLREKNLHWDNRQLKTPNSPCERVKMQELEGRGLRSPRGLMPVKPQ